MSSIRGSSNSTEIDLLGGTSIEQTAEIFCDLRSTRLTSLQLLLDPPSYLTPFRMAILCRQRPTCFDKLGNLLLLYRR